METILMHGPGISNPDIIVEREVPLADVQAYKAAGYKEGPNPNKEFATIGVVYSEQDAAEQAGLTEALPEPEKPARKAAKRK